MVNLGQGDSLVCTGPLSLDSPIEDDHSFHYSDEIPSFSLPIKDRTIPQPRLFGGGSNIVTRTIQSIEVSGVIRRSKKAKRDQLHSGFDELLQKFIVGSKSVKKKPDMAKATSTPIRVTTAMNNNVSAPHWAPTSGDNTSPIGIDVSNSLPLPPSDNITEVIDLCTPPIQLSPPRQATPPRHATSPRQATPPRQSTPRQVTPQRQITSQRRSTPPRRPSPPKELSPPKEPSPQPTASDSSCKSIPVTVGPNVVPPSQSKGGQLQRSIAVQTPRIDSVQPPMATSMDHNSAVSDRSHDQGISSQAHIPEPPAPPRTDHNNVEAGVNIKRHDETGMLVCAEGHEPMVVLRHQVNHHHKTKHTADYFPPKLRAIISKVLRDKNCPLDHIPCNIRTKLPAIPIYNGTYCFGCRKCFRPNWDYNCRCGLHKPSVDFQICQPNTTVIVGPMPENPYGPKRRVVNNGTPMTNTVPQQSQTTIASQSFMVNDVPPPQVNDAPAQVTNVPSPQVSNVAHPQVNKVAHPQVNKVAPPQVNNAPPPQVNNMPPLKVIHYVPPPSMCNNPASSSQQSASVPAPRQNHSVPPHMPNNSVRPSRPNTSVQSPRQNLSVPPPRQSLSVPQDLPPRPRPVTTAPPSRQSYGQPSGNRVSKNTSRMPYCPSTYDWMAPQRRQRRKTNLLGYMKRVGMM